MHRIDREKEILSEWIERDCPHERRSDSPGLNWHRQIGWKSAYLPSTGVAFVYAVRSVHKNQLRSASLYGQRWWGGERQVRQSERTRIDSSLRYRYAGFRMASLLTYKLLPLQDSRFFLYLCSLIYLWPLASNTRGTGTKRCENPRVVFSVSTPGYVLSSQNLVW